MKENTSLLPDRIAFIADAHLGIPGETTERIEKVAEFIRQMQGWISHLYIVGDLFDFWFEYSSVIPRTASHVIFELYNLVRSGTVVTVFAGNHDYWFGSYLKDDVGIHIVLDDLSVEHQGRKLYLHHGDGLYPHDHGYRLLKRVIRNPLSIFLFKLIHPDWAKKIASVTSLTSRKYIAPVKNPEFYYDLFRAIADKRLAEDYDAVIYGHTHLPLVEQRNGGTLVLLGDWITRNTCTILENGEFSQYTWDETGENNHGPDS